jgi:hypothetical protein
MRLSLIEKRAALPEQREYRIRRQLKNGIPIAHYDGSRCGIQEEMATGS